MRHTSFVYVLALTLISATVVAQNNSEQKDKVITVGYGVQHKSDINGAISSVDADDLKSLSTTDVTAALQGKAAGIHISNISGMPGASGQISIRGYASLQGNLGPLLIVDGLKVDNLHYLDPSMIQSVEFLKDAASAAIYGAESGNGVVLITTKTGRGRNGLPQIAYSFKAINQSLGKAPGIFGAKEWIKYKEMSGFDIKNLCTLFGVDYNNPQETNWVNEVFGNSLATQHSLTIQYSNDKLHTYLSGNYVINDGIVRGKKDKYKHLSGQLNVDYQLFKWGKIGINMNADDWTIHPVLHQDAYHSMFTPMLLLDPLTPVYWSSPDQFTEEMKAKYNENPAMIPIAPNGKYYATSQFAQDENGNPLFQRDHYNYTVDGWGVRGTAFLELRPIEELVITSRFSHRNVHGKSRNYSEPYYLNSQTQSTDYSLLKRVNESQYYQFENFANYNQTFFDKHNVGGMIGMSYTKSHSDGGSALAISSNDKTISVDTQGRFTSLSYFGRLLYVFDNRYSAQFSYRSDAFSSSKPQMDRRWGNFPSASLGWTFSNERFIKDNISTDILSFLKFRASWGRNANVCHPYFPKLNWETSEQLDFGLDMRFLKNRLAVNFDYYNKETEDLHFTYTTASDVYFNAAIASNIGGVNNSGVEVELAWHDNIGNLAYSASGNFSTLKNKVTHLPDFELITSSVGGISNQMVTTAFKEGHSMWYFHAYDYAGVNKETGAALFRNANGDIVSSSELTPNDMKDVGNALPKYIFGLTFNLAYKNFDFTLFGAGVAGNKIFNALYRVDSPLRNSLKYYMDNAWSSENRNASMPHPTNVATDYRFWSSSAAMFDGSYFKIKQIQLGYTLPENITKKVFVREFRLFVSLDDFFTFTSYPGMDPETATSGVAGTPGSGFDIGNYPTMKKMTLGASIAF
jgi:TonB-dependent SusC/RagA subfamily outer membrane receptor